MNTTTCLDRDQILNLCELIHTACSGNLSGGRISHLGVVPLHPDHFVDAQAQSHPGVAGRHPHGLPIHHLKSGGGLHPFDRRTPPSVDTSSGGPRPRSSSTSSTALWRPAGHGRSVPNCTQESTTRRGWIRGWPDTSPGSQNHQWAVFMMRRPSRMLTHSRPQVLSDQGFAGRGVACEQASRDTRWPRQLLQVPDAIAWSHVKVGDRKRRIAPLVDGLE